MRTDNYFWILVSDNGKTKLNTFACHTHSAAQQITAQTEEGATHLWKTKGQAVHGNILENHGSFWKTPSKRHTTPNHTNSRTYPSTSSSPRFPDAFRQRTKTKARDRTRDDMFQHFPPPRPSHHTMQSRTLDRSTSVRGSLDAVSQRTIGWNQPEPYEPGLIQCSKTSLHKSLIARQIILRSLCIGKRTVYKINTRTVRGTFQRSSVRKISPCPGSQRHWTLSSHPSLAHESQFERAKQ